MGDLLLRSPLSNVRAFSAEGFALRELAGVTKMRVQALRRRWLSTPAADPERLPDAPNTTRGIDPIALWRAPDDWLVYSPTLEADAVHSWTGAITADVPLMLTDISSGNVVLELIGPRAVEILLRDCPLDLEGDAVRPSACAQTSFAQTGVLIHRPADSTWRLFVERSVASHVWEWLVDSAGSLAGAAG